MTHCSGPIMKDLGLRSGRKGYTHTRTTRAYGRGEGREDGFSLWGIQG